MRSVVRLVCLLVPLLGAVGCTQDFSAFRFEQKPDETRENPSSRPPRDGGPSSSSTPEGGPMMPAADSGGASAADAAPDGAPASMDAAMSGRRDAATPPATEAGSNHPPPGRLPDGGPVTPATPDAGSVIDSGLGRADSGADAGEAELMMCQTALEELQTGSDTCHECACDWCATQVLDCLVRGSEVERALCADVLRCSLQNQCQDYTCYCRTPGCNVPEPVGNGPCAAVVNRAANGTRTRVDALRNANPLDPNEPLIRAGQAIACIYGVHSASPGEPVNGNCTSTCR